MASQSLAKKAPPKAQQQSLATQKNKLLPTKERIEEGLEGVREELAPFVSKQESIAKSIANVEIIDAKTYERVVLLRADARQNAEQGEEKLDPFIDLAYFLHKGFTGIRKEITTAEDANVKAANAKLLVWDEHIAEEQRKADQARQEQARLEQQEEQRKQRIEADRLEAIAQKEREEAEAKQREAERIAAEARERRDPVMMAKATELALEAQASTDAAQEVTQEAMAASAQAIAPAESVSHVKAAPVFTARASTPAVSWVDNWKGFCTDPAAMLKFVAGIPQDQPLAHPEMVGLIFKFDYDPDDQNKTRFTSPALKKMAEAQKQFMAIPGCAAWNHKYPRGGKRT